MSFFFSRFSSLVTILFLQIAAGMSLEESADMRDYGIVEFDTFRIWWQRYSAKTWSAGSSHLVLFLVCALPAPLSRVFIIYTHGPDVEFLLIIFIRKGAVPLCAAP